VFGPGSGQDTIVESQGNLDTIRMAPGVAPSDVVVTRNNRDLMLSLNGGADQLTVSLYFVASSLEVERVLFADGTVWDHTVIETLAQPATNGTAGSDSLIGTSGDDRLAGLGGDDQLTGLAGNDLLDGGTGADTLTGGLGNDTYLVDDTGDVVIEAASEGIDTVQSSMSHSLAANVENLTLAGSGAIDGIGNDLDNVLEGNSAANVLTAGLGNDTYVVGEGDSVVELAGAGIDTVASEIGYVLGANIENLTLAGNQAIRGVGNDLDNVLTGNAAPNILTGGRGNDTYVVGIDDTVGELSGEGTDTIETTSSYSLGANLENLILRDEGLSANVNGLDLTGNELDNVLTGNAGPNVLAGREGADRLNGGGGGDTLVGGSGQDVYLFQHGSGQDVIQDVVFGETDTIQLGPDISPSGVRVALNDASELFLEIRGTSDRLTLHNYAPLNPNDQATKEVRFADGTLWDGATLASQIEFPPGPNPGQFFAGILGNDVLVARIIQLALRSQPDKHFRGICRRRYTRWPRRE
jgi:Ca2+-binding RTX toxin-like protein